MRGDIYAIENHMSKLTFTLNNQPLTLDDIPPSLTLLDVLRDHLKLTGTRLTCGIGVCGACTVLVDGDAMSGCLLLVPMIAGRSITTIEGLAAPDGTLDVVQQAYVDCMGLQCSYCTPGFILATHALLKENPKPTEAEIKEYLAGNLCRCGSYYKIIDAVKLASERLSP
jgi:aerobic-type carbon monoxide dehydrogenase small subunit (CoxS/CutS family)